MPISIIAGAKSPQYQEIKEGLHAKILDEIDLESLIRLKEETARERLNQEIRELLRREKAPLTQQERDSIAVELLHEVFGLGPIEPLLADPTVSDILVNGPFEVYVERRGLLEKTAIKFMDAGHLMRIIDRIVSRVGRRVDESSPMVDARLLDGSRVNVIIPPLSLIGPVLSIRRFGVNPLTAEDLANNGSLTVDMLEFLKACVRGKLNLLISGGTGAGKTTLLNVLSASVPESERIITIEDAAELLLKQEHVVRLETRPPNIEGEGAVKQRQLVINALRMRPDRIIVGEVRGEESVDMLQAMNTGHEGSMTTIHANTPRDALSRLETMISMANLNLPEKAARQQIASAIHVVIQISRLPDGGRRITSISEITGMEGNTVTMQEIFVFERQGYDDRNKVRGRFRSTGIRPKFAERLFAAGIPLANEWFASDVLSRRT
jgi:pilus assembly protein CpaF